MLNVNFIHIRAGLCLKESGECETVLLITVGRCSSFFSSWGLQTISKIDTKTFLFKSPPSSVFVLLFGHLTKLHSLLCAKKLCFSFNRKNQTKKTIIAQFELKIMKSRTKQSSTSGAITATTKAAATCDSPKHYPSISAAYWLPAPTTPYLLPGKVPILSLIVRLSAELPAKRRSRFGNN